MKKILNCIFCFTLIISASLIFFACKGKDLVLQTPSRIGLVNNEIYDAETDEYKDNYMLVTVENKNALKYRFFITSSADYQNLDNYISIDSDKNYVEINDYFYNKLDTLKVYHYFVQYIAKKNYKNSGYSKIQTFTPEKKVLSAPYIQMKENKIFWTKVTNSEKYEISETIYKKTDEGFEVEKVNKIEVLKNIFEYDFSKRVDSPYKKYSYKVKAIGTGFYANSQESNEETYVKKITLQTPKNLKITDKVLSFDEVEYASSYSLFVDGTFVKNFEGESVDISEYLNEYKNYTFSVQATLSDVLDFEKSDKSDSLTFAHKTKLDAPTFSSESDLRDGQYLKISFTGVQLATKYEISIFYNGNSIFNTTTEVTNVEILISQLFDNLTENKDITIKIKSQNGNQFVEDSDYAVLNYTLVA